jgi:hypothetical protein
MFLLTYNLSHKFAHVTALDFHERPVNSAVGLLQLEAMGLQFIMGRIYM